MKTAPLSLDLLRIDGGTQSRLCINQDAVDDYAEIISAAPATEWPFPPLDVFHDGSAYFVADGFHRCLGAVRAKRGSVPCVVHKGTATDALVFGMTANDKNGLRRTREDKRYCVELLLDSGVKMPQKEIAQKAGVSERLVKMIVADRNPQSLAGKLPTPHSNRHVAPSTPSGGDSDPFGEFDPSDWPEPGGEVEQVEQTKGKGKPKTQGKPITAKTGRSAEIWTAQQVFKTWIDAIGRWMNGNPAGIDVYREKFPGPLGDKVIESAKELLNALDAWKKGLK